MTSIHVLQRSVAERIAAGEVVERPASVVKELIENSLDAGAGSITVEIEHNGLGLIRISDDGEGIPSGDVALALERFATSKIASLDDLDRVATYGFRGEALPSIAAVSEATLTTRTAADAAGTRLAAVGGAIGRSAPWGAPRGTVVEVRRLFFNTPARLKFLKSPAREQALIAEVVQRAALAHPEVAFRLVLDGREAGRWPQASAEYRASDLVGPAADLIPVGGSVPGGRLRGWLVRPERARPTRSGQQLFVNRRPVQSSLLRRAVEQGYAQLVTVGRFPAFAIFLDIVPAAVDINVHPRKLEVRFREESHLFGAVARAVRDALLASPLVRRVEGGLSTVPAASGVNLGADAGPSLRLGAGAAPEAIAGTGVLAGIRETGGDYGLASPGRLPPLQPLGQVLDTYIVAAAPTGLYLIDQHAAHERIVYERLLAARRRGTTASQMLAIPATLELTPAELALVVGHTDLLATLGFVLEPFGARTVLVRALPAGANGTSLDALLHRAVASLGGDASPEAALERLTIATACHTAIRAGDRLDAGAIAALLADLAAAEDPFTCFHGRPTMVAIRGPDLERWFLRG